jgi:hypothetical protein
MIPASIRFSNIAVQENAVQQPVQQRRRTSAKNNNTQRTERSSFQHTMHTGEHQRTGCVESPLRHAEQNTRSPEELKRLYKGLERIWVRVFTILTANVTLGFPPDAPSTPHCSLNATIASKVCLIPKK